MPKAAVLFIGGDSDEALHLVTGSLIAVCLALKIVRGGWLAARVWRGLTSQNDDIEAAADP
jgi:hypothetical protein